MNRQFATTQPMGKPSTYRVAIVIGGSIAGLTSARVLTDYFERVIVIERDPAPNVAIQRKGAPQARHPHILLARGQQILEQLFPGLVAELVQAGAISLDMGHDLPFCVDGAWCEPFHSEIHSTACSRRLLEYTIYRRLALHPKVYFVHEHEVAGLCVDKTQTHVSGVRLRAHATPTATNSELAADLVIDASGRESQAPQWLIGLGYEAPLETIVNAFPGYSTRIFRVPANHSETWKGLYSLVTAPDHTRGALIMPLEADEGGARWHVCLVGMAGDYPPTEEAAFWDFLRSLPSPRIYDTLKDAEPLHPPLAIARQRIAYARSRRWGAILKVSW